MPADAEAMITTKQALRAAMKAKLAVMSDEARAVQSQQIVEKVSSMSI